MERAYARARRLKVNKAQARPSPLCAKAWQAFYVGSAPGSAPKLQVEPVIRTQKQAQNRLESNFVQARAQCVKLGLGSGSKNSGSFHLQPRSAFRGSQQIRNFSEIPAINVIVFVVVVVVVVVVSRRRRRRSRRPCCHSPPTLDRSNQLFHPKFEADTFEILIT